MFMSTFVIAALGTWVTEKMVIPRLGAYEGRRSSPRSELQPLTAAEKTGLWWALAVNLYWSPGVWGLVPADGFLRDPETGSVLHSPFMHGIVTFIFLGGLLSAWPTAWPRAPSRATAT